MTGLWLRRYSERPQDHGDDLASTQSEPTPRELLSFSGSAMRCDVVRTRIQHVLKASGEYAGPNTYQVPRHTPRRIVSVGGLAQVATPPVWDSLGLGHAVWHDEFHTGTHVSLWMHSADPGATATPLGTKLCDIPLTGHPWPLGLAVPAGMHLYCWADYYTLSSQTYSDLFAGQVHVGVALERVAGDTPGHPV